MFLKIYLFQNARRRIISRTADLRISRLDRQPGEDLIIHYLHNRKHDLGTKKHDLPAKKHYLNTNEQ